jgi:hypothetical protein
MPIIGFGILHFAVALFFAVHALRNRQQMYWLIILFSFPVLGSLAYFFAVFLPGSRMERSVKKMATSTAKSIVSALDPTRELREAKEVFDYTPTAQNQMRLAAALYGMGHFSEAVKNYEACLNGPFSSDVEMRYGAALAYIGNTQHAQAITHLEAIRATNPQFKPEEIALTIARTLTAAGRNADAKAELAAANARFASAEVRAEYAIALVAAGEIRQATEIHDEIQRDMKRWSSHTRDLYMPVIRRLDAALSAALNPKS